VERGVLSILQTRSAEMGHHSSPRTFEEPGPADGRGIGISGGAFRGVIAFDAEDVSMLTSSDLESRTDVDGILLVLENPIPDEIPLILSVDGLLAARGGSTSHAAVAVHGIDDKPFSAVLGVGELRVHGKSAEIRPTGGRSSRTFRTGDVVSIHGQTGEVFAGPRQIRESTR
jgi:pyruvate,orthophosphate dikinase